MSDNTRGFEILAAIVLGLGAVGGAWAGYQANQWGATAISDFGDASTTATKASTLLNVGISVANRDAQLDIQAKQLVLEASTTEDEVVKERSLAVARYLYTQQMSDEGYKSLGYPPEYRVEDTTKEAPDIPEQVLVAGLDHELGDEYFDQVLSDGSDQFTEADKKFDHGNAMSNRSTQFGLDAVFFTVCLFLAGIGLVIHTRMHWVLLGLSGVALVVASIYMFRLPWYWA